MQHCFPADLSLLNTILSSK